MSSLTKKSLEINNQLVKLLYESFNNDISNLKHNETKKKIVDIIDVIINKSSILNYIEVKNDKITFETRKNN